MNITRSLLLSTLSLTLLFPACTEQDKGAEENTAPADTPAAVAPAFDPAQVQAQPVTNTATATITDPNPEHGQPGHRCEIPVGASLATAPPPGAPAAAPTTSPMLNTSPVQTTPVQTAPVTTTTATAPGMNPPHGQPGHDCAVAVGAPLPKK